MLLLVSPGTPSVPQVVAPSAVTNMALLGSPTTTGFSLSFTAPSTGTAPLSYAIYTSPHGSGVWVLNSGTVNATAGLASFTGLAQSTNYDARIVVSNSAGSATTDLTIGVSTAAPPAPTGQANRYDAAASVSGVAPNTATTIALSANGFWPATGRITPTSSGTGTFSPTSITLSGGSTPATLTYTPTVAGEHNISFTNTAGVFDPYPVPLNCWASSSGTAQTLAATLVLGDQAVHQRDVPSGSPVGFTIAGTNGWGEVWVNVSAIGGTTGALYARLYDAQSTGATTTAGSGKELTSGAVQVYGPVSATGEKRLLLPAVRGKMIWCDLATDAGMTNPIRIANRFKIGTVIGVATRSQLAGWLRGYAEGDTHSPLGLSSWSQTAVSFSADYRYSDTSGQWFRIDGVKGDPISYDDKIYGEGCSAATMEAGRLIDQATGTMLGIAGVAATSGGLDEFVSADGTLMDVFRLTVATSCRSKCRMIVIAATAMDNSTETTTLDQQTYANALARIPLAYPACAVIGWNTGATGWFGDNGSSDLGYTRNQNFFLSREASNPMLVSLEDHNWSAWRGGHATQASKAVWMHAHMRLLLSAEQAAWGGLQTLQRGPTLAATGTIASGSNVIRIPYKLNGSTSLNGSEIRLTSDIAYTTSIGTATHSNLASLFAVYTAGGRCGTGQAILISSAAINTASPPSGYDGTIDITLSGSSSVTLKNADGSSGGTAPIPAQMTVQALADFNWCGGDGSEWYADATGRATVLHGDADPLGVGIGAHMRPQLDIAITTV